MARVSSKPSADTVYFEAGSQAHIDDLIATQNAARENQGATATAKNWAPWVLGGLALAGVVFLVTRDD